MERQPTQQPELEQLPAVYQIHERQNDNLHVQLFWIEGTDQTYVTVDDTKGDEHFYLEVPSPDKALDVFYHPYSYRARGVANGGTAAAA